MSFRELRGILAADLRQTRERRMRLWLMLFRFAHLARGTGPSPRAASLPLLLVYKVVCAFLKIDVPARTAIGPGLAVSHGFGLVVNANAVIGSNCVLKHNVTIGVRSAGGVCPVIGDRVEIGSGAQILGDVQIGDDARIGAGAIVLDDVPANATAVSPKARIIAGRRLERPLDSAKPDA